MAAAVSLQVHTFYLPNQEYQPSQSPQTGTYTPDTCVPSTLAPNLSHILDDQLSLSASNPDRQSFRQFLCSPLARPSWNPWEPVHYPSLLPLKGAHTPLCSVACACLGASQELLLTEVLLKTHKHKLLWCHTAITHCIINWPQLQADLVPQYYVWKPGTRTVEAVSHKITLFVAVIEPGPAAGTQQLLLRKSAPHCPLPPLSLGPHPGLPTRSPSHTKNTQLTKPALGCSHSTLKIQRLTILPSANKRRIQSSIYL